MFTKLNTIANPNAITFFTTADDKMYDVLAHVTSGTQSQFRDEAKKLFDFASRLGFDETKLATAIKMRNESRVVTITQVCRNQYSISYIGDGYVDVECFVGTERELRRHLHAMRKAGKKIVQTCNDRTLETGYKFGSMNRNKQNPYTFGTVWADRIEGQPHLISRMLKTLARYEFAVYSAKDDLLELVAKKYVGGVAA